MKPQPRGIGCVNCARPDQWGASSGLRPGGPIPEAVKLVQDNVTEKMDAAFFASNKPNHSNTFDRNYYSGKLIHFVVKENAVTNNVEVKGSNWPPEAVKIMKEAGPRGAYRRPEVSNQSKL